ncbi:hypothetical protein KIPB_007895 [Kipferlia bialata]|uniref:Uncharacterized protein n=1 Tax=Kipferlia bialata TaxID=797122 RepID=A0A391NSQ8_9EUKA|nr:hypothetical protein KIPB_007895 [Kipferlia bialata]|eukprot:g7895.t1
MEQGSTLHHARVLSLTESLRDQERHCEAEVGRKRSVCESRLASLAQSHSEELAGLEREMERQREVYEIRVESLTKSLSDHNPDVTAWR